MKSTGIVRKIDDLGRVVIAKETRRALRIEEGDPLEQFVQGDMIILKKHGKFCAHCGSQEEGELIAFKQGHICEDCRDEIRELL